MVTNSKQGFGPVCLAWWSGTDEIANREITMDKQKAYEIVKSLGEMAITMHKEVDPDQQPINMHLGSTLLIGLGAYRKFEMEGHDKQLDQAYAIISDELVDHLYEECWDELTANKNNA